MDPEGEIETRCSECERSMLATLREVMAPEPIFCSVACEEAYATDGCEHVSVTTPDGYGAYCGICGETVA